MRIAFCALVASVALAAGCTTSKPAPSATVYDPSTLPGGPLGAQIRYGREIIMQTRHVMAGFVNVRMDCAACHIDGGTRPRGGSFVGTYAAFPQWNRRAKRVIALQDRLAECFLYSMNGKPPAYSSREMIALVAYIAWLSRGVQTLATPAPAQRFIVPLPSGSPNAVRGAALYAQRCSLCHQANGAGAGAVPPLWGIGSFNNGAGMAHIDRMTGFVKFNMPQNAPGTLSLRDAYDISAFVLSHARPTFKKNALVMFHTQPAHYF